MTAAVGMDLGAEMETGGRTGQEPDPAAGARPGKELSASWLRPASGNLATGLASGAPSFRSSWQSQVNAWRGVSRGTSGVESEDANDAGTIDTINGAPTSRATNSPRTSASAQTAGSSFPLKNAAAPQSASAIEVSSQKGTWSQTSRSASQARQSADDQSTSTGSTDASAIERAGTANSYRKSSASQHTCQENAAQAATSGTQTVAPLIATPIEPPVQSQISKPAQTAETASASEGSFEFLRWPSALSSGWSQLSGAEESASAAAGFVARGASGSGTASGLWTPVARASSASILPNAARSAAIHGTVALSLNDADEPAASPQMIAPASSDTRSAEPLHEQWTARNSITGEGPSGHSVAAPTLDNSAHLASAESAAPSAAALLDDDGAAETRTEPAQSSTTQSIDRALLRAANRNVAGETVQGATPLAAAQPAIVETAATSELRNPGATHIDPATGHPSVTTATSAAANTQDTFSALDAGTSPGTPAWTFAGSQHAEAGFRDPALGWVGVRADLNGDGIHATLVPSSAEAAQALNGHLSGLSSHLVEQQASVASLTMASPGESGIENGMGQRMQQGAEGDSQRNAPDESPAGSPLNASPAMSGPFQGASAQDGLRDPFTRTGELRGAHISVMA